MKKLLVIDAETVISGLSAENLQLSLEGDAVPSPNHTLKRSGLGSFAEKVGECGMEN